MTIRGVKRRGSRSFWVLAVFVALATIALAGAGAAEAGEFGIESVSASRTTSQAGAHPDVTTTVTIKTDPSSAPDGDGDREPYGVTRDLSVGLPAGMTGDPHAVGTCTIAQFAAALEGGGCPLDSQVGVTILHLRNLEAPLHEPVFNLEAAGGDGVARLGFFGYSIPVIMTVQMRSEGDYGLTATAKGANALYPLVSATTTLWGVPAASSHNTERFTPEEVLKKPETTESPSQSTGRAPEAFMSNPTSCGVRQVVFAAADSYSEPGRVVTGETEMPETTGCGLLAFGPKVTIDPTGSAADSPAGMAVDFTVDQTGLSQTTLTRPADLKKVVVTLPASMSLNPAAAGGLGGCSENEVGLISLQPIHFNTAVPSCPESSKIGTAEITAPALNGPIHGSLYVANQGANPFGSLLAGYLVAQGQGATIKLAGRFDLDPSTGQITATFDGNPQQPFSDLSLRFKGGPRGVLVNPPQCGTYQIHTSLVPWSALDPENPAPSEVVETTNSFAVTSGPDGSPCPAPTLFSPAFEAGSATPLAGSYSPLGVRVSRPDGSQTITKVETALPPGVIAKLAGVPYCSEAAIAAASAPGRSGATELAASSCPGASRVGSADVGSGAGSSPLHVPGSAYLAGPYKGAPLSLAVITPAVAGPFDLGTVVVRVALYVNPVTAQVRAVSDPLPTILRGVPLHLRSVIVNIDRPGFSRNPTSCDPMQVEGTLTGTPDLKTLVDRFQVGGCKGLDFKPELSLRLRGGLKRSQFPALTAVLRAKDGEADIKRVSVALPHSEFLASKHMVGKGVICTRVQFAADKCPTGSIHGYAKAWSPLLDKPLKGPVYLRSSSHELPDLVADLHGQINIELDGRIDEVHEGMRTTFASVPDAPVTKFVLKMKGGKKGLLENSEDLCETSAKAIVKMDAHNGEFLDFAAPLHKRCGKKGH